jgi:hypothetical protein
MEQQILDALLKLSQAQLEISMNVSKISENHLKSINKLIIGFAVCVLLICSVLFYLIFQSYNYDGNSIPPINNYNSNSTEVKN